MPTFKYKARGPSGKVETKVTEAQSQDALVTQLQERGLLVLSVAKTDKQASSGKTYRVKFHNRVKAKDLIMLSTQLATTLKANIPLLKSLEIQQQQATSRKLKTVLEDICENVRQGHSLKDSMARHPKIFTSIWLNLIETGETSGQLPAVLHQLTEYLVAKEDLKRKTLTAMIYPAAILVVSIAAVYIFTVKIIPIFANAFSGLGIELPLITRIVIGVSEFMQSHILLTFVSVGLFIFLAHRYGKTATGRRVYDSLLFRIPIFGSFFLHASIEKFSSTLCILLQSGIPIMQALDIIAKISGNKIIEEAILKAKGDVRDGKSFATSLAQSQIFPPLTINMCLVGEETGQLSDMLGQITKYYRDEMNTFDERLSATLEPLIIIVMGGFVAVLVFALYMAIFKIASM